MCEFVQGLTCCCLLLSLAVPPPIAPGVCGDPFQTVTNPSLGSYFANMAPMAATTFSAGQRVRFSWTVSGQLLVWGVLSMGSRQLVGQS